MCSRNHDKTNWYLLAMVMGQNKPILVKTLSAGRNKGLLRTFAAARRYAVMENFDQKWLEVQSILRERFGKVPDMEGILFLIGLNELGAPPVKKFTKEQKQDIMHIAVCTLLSQLGYYAYVGNDEDGWPHFERLDIPESNGLANQETLLKECVVRYFEV